MMRETYVAVANTAMHHHQEVNSVHTTLLKLANHNLVSSVKLAVILVGFLVAVTGYIREQFKAEKRSVGLWCEWI